MKQRDDWHLTDVVEHALGQGDPFAAAVRATRMPMVITDPSQSDNPIVFANEAFQHLTGYTREEIIGRNCRFLQGERTDKGDVELVRQAIADGKAIAVELLNYRKDGSTFWNALYLSPVQDEAGTTKYFFASQLDVTERVDAQKKIAEQKRVIEQEVSRRTAELEAALEAKSVLLHEIDHRVKNNLTLIGSLLRLQARTIADPDVRSKLTAMLERIDALATVHRRLYQSDDLQLFDVGSFASTLLNDIIALSGRTDVQTKVDCRAIEVPASHATSLGLLLNEIFTNAMKHAFADRQNGTLELSSSVVGRTATIVVADSGPGFDVAAAKKGLGRTLIERLAQQAQADVDVESSSRGTTYRITFEMAR